MSTYQKTAALVFRLASLGLVIYALFYTVYMLFAMAGGLQGALIVMTMKLPVFIGGIVLYLSSFPLAKLTTFGFKE